MTWWEAILAGLGALGGQQALSALVQAIQRRRMDAAGATKIEAEASAITTGSIVEIQQQLFVQMQSELKRIDNQREHEFLEYTRRLSACEVKCQSLEAKCAECLALLAATGL